MAPGFDATFTSLFKTVTVAAPVITLSDAFGETQRVGGGLQLTYRATLSGPQHGGITLRLTSDNPSVLRISDSALIAGTSVVDIPILNGSTIVDFTVQGVAGVTGLSTVTASHAAFVDDTEGFTVVEPILRIINLSTTRTVASTDDPFRVQTGIRNVTGTTFERAQEVNPVSAPIQVLVGSSVPAIGQLVTTVSTGASVTVEVPVNSTVSANSVATGGVAFDSLATGSTDIGISALGFGSLPSSDTLTVTINP